MTKIEIVRPEEIEKRSMEIITSELNGRTWPEPQFSIIKRCIHTSADFDYADNLCFSEKAAEIGIQALRNGASLPIPKWLRPALTRKRWQNTAARFTASCAMPK